MRIRDFRADDSPQIDLVPLIDVVLCLIVFFVITTTFDTRSVLKLQLPHARGETAEAQQDVLELLVNADGRSSARSSRWPATTAGAACCCAPTRAPRTRR